MRVHQHQPASGWHKRTLCVHLACRCAAPPFHVTSPRCSCCQRAHRQPLLHQAGPNGLSGREMGVAQAGRKCAMKKVCLLITTRALAGTTACAHRKGLRQRQQLLAALHKVWHSRDSHDAQAIGPKSCAQLSREVCVLVQQALVGDAHRSGARAG